MSPGSTIFLIWPRASALPTVALLPTTVLAVSLICISSSSLDINLLNDLVP